MKRFTIKTSGFFALFTAGIFSIKKLLLLLIVCLAFLAFNAQANQADDAVALEHLQKQIDAENQAAHDKAEKKWQEEHGSSGGGGSLGGWLCFFGLPAMILYGICKGK